jgi:hypothetical protein
MYSPQITPFQPSNIDATTKMLMGLQQKGQLQQYVAQRKNDPNLVALALYVSNMSKARPAVQAEANQPKIVDQAIAGMAPQQMMPEDQGIATLPAPNMQNMAGGGIVAFDDGGEVPGYAEGVLTKAKKKYKEMKGYEFEGGPELFEKALDAEGIRDPKQRAFLKAIHAQESDQALNAPTRDKSGAMGPMQVTRDAWTDVSKKGDALKNRSDPFENMRAGIRYASTGWQKSGGDPVLAGTYYYGGPGGLAKAQKGEAVAASEDKGQTTLQYGKQVASRMPSMIPFVATATAAPVAQAAPQGIAALTSDPATGFSVPQDVFSPSPEEERKYAAAQAQAKKNADVVSQIPGQSVKAPAFKDTNTYFGGVADEMGIPLEVQRNIANTINATSGYTAPIGGINRAASTVSKGLEPTAEMLQKAEQAKLLTTSDLTKKIVEAPRIPFSAKPGLEGLDEASAATRAAAEQARRMRQLEQDRKAAVGAEQSVDAATKSAAIADKMAKEQAALVDAARLSQAKLTGAAQGLAGMQALDKADIMPKGGAGVADLVPNKNIGESVFDPTFGGTMPLPSAAKEEVPEGLAVKDLPKDPITGGTDWNRLMLQMGLHLMAGKSPNALTNIGEAGIGALTMQQAEEKFKSEAEYRRALGRQAARPSAAIQELEWARDPENMKLLKQIAQAKADPKASSAEALAFLKDNGLVLKELDPVLYGVLRNKVLGYAAPGSYLDTAPKDATIR